MTTVELTKGVAEKASYGQKGPVQSPTEVKGCEMNRGAG